MTNPIDIRPEHLAIVKQILADTLPPESKCWVFGSRAKWTAKDSSDLDLAIDSGKALTKQQSFALSDAFEESDLPYKVDVVDLHNMSESFRAIIERDKVPLPDSAPLSAFADQKRGITYGVVQPGQPDPAGIPIIRVNNIRHGRISTSDVMRISPDIEKKYQRTRLQGGEVLLTLVGTLGEVAIAGNDLKGWNVACAVAVIPPAKNVSAKWLHICLSSAEAQHKMRSRATTTVQATLNLRDVAELPIYIPARKTQDYIEKAVSAIDEKMELNRRMNATLEAMVRALFKSWFVDFDPVRAKMEGRAPDGLSADIAALFPDTLADSPLGEIPNGWAESDLSHLCLLNSESWTTRNHPEHVEYIDLANTKWGTIESTQQYSWNDAPSRAKRIVRPGDTIVGTVRSGNGSYAYINRESYTASTGFAVLRPIKPQYAELIYLAVTAPENIERLSHLADGGAYPAVRSEIVLATPIVAANDKIFSAFSEIIKPSFNRIEKNKEENQTLAQLRDTLLPKLISGQLRVTGTASSIKEAV